MREIAAPNDGNIAPKPIKTGPCLIIGLGGTGTRMLNYLRESLLDVYGSLRDCKVISFGTCDKPLNNLSESRFGLGIGFQEPRSSAGELTPHLQKTLVPAAPVHLPVDVDAFQEEVDTHRGLRDHRHTLAEQMYSLLLPEMYADRFEQETLDQIVQPISRRSIVESINALRKAAEDTLVAQQSGALDNALRKVKDTLAVLQFAHSGKRRVDPIIFGIEHIDADGNTRRLICDKVDCLMLLISQGDYIKNISTIQTGKALMSFTNTSEGVMTDVPVYRLTNPIDVTRAWGQDAILHSTRVTTTRLGCMQEESCQSTARNAHIVDLDMSYGPGQNKHYLVLSLVLGVILSVMSGRPQLPLRWPLPLPATD